MDEQQIKAVERKVEKFDLLVYRLFRGMKVPRRPPSPSRALSRHGTGGGDDDVNRPLKEHG